MIADPHSVKSGQRHFTGMLEPILWFVLTGLALAGLSGLFVMMGLFMLVLPGAVLLLAPNLLIYGTPIRIAIWIWRDRRSAIGAIFALCAGAGLALWPPTLVNNNLQAEALRLQGNDFDLVTRDMPAPRTVRLDLAGAPSGCGDVCKALLNKGLADRVVTGAPTDEAQTPNQMIVFHVSKGNACPAARGTSQVTAGACILREVESAPKIDALIRVVSLGDEDRKADTAEARLDPLNPGRQSVEFLEFWPCAEVEACSALARLTDVRQERLIAPLFLYVDSRDHGMELHRAWARYQRGGGRADPVAFLASKWPRTPRLPQRKESLEVISDMGTLAARADPFEDREGVRKALWAFREGAGPLSPAEVKLLRKLFDGRAHDIPVDLAQRPEVVDAVKDLLGHVLLSQAGQDNSMLWTAQSLIADLPEQDFQRLRPILLTWLRRSNLAVGRNNERFLLRLSDLGPVIVRPLSTGMLYRNGPLVGDLTVGETTASLAALCLVGDPGAIPELRRRLGEITDSRFKKSELRALNTTVDRIEGRAPKSLCLEIFPVAPGNGKVWVNQFARDRGIFPGG